MEHSTDKADAFDCKVSKHICQVGNINGTDLIGKWLEDCFIDIDTAWEFAQDSACTVALDFEENPLEGFETNTPHLNNALPAKVDYDIISE